MSEQITRVKINDVLIASLRDVSVSFEADKIGDGVQGYSTVLKEINITGQVRREEMPVPKPLSYYNSFAEGYTAAIAVLNTPHKVICESWNPSMCPRCGHTFEEYEPCHDGYYDRAKSLSRCPHCGQRLDWDEE